MPCTPDRRLLLIHVPKTGGTSLEQALGMHGPWDQENQQILYGEIKDSTLLARSWSSAFLQHLTWQELQQRWSLELADSVTLAAVRNPWARFASVFTNTDTHLKLMAKERGVELEGLSFADFVDATEALDHAHLRPQRDYLVDTADVLMVPNLLRTEVLGRDFRRFCVQHDIKAELPWANRSGQSIPYEQHYCPSSWQRIGERYCADVALWEQLNKES